MKKTTLLLFILFASFSLVSQKKTESNWDFAVRAKIAAFFVIEDAYFSTGTIGGEFIYKQRHCFGLDYSFFNWQIQTDGDFTDSVGNFIHDIPLYDEYERKSYLLLDYKYIFSSLKKKTVWYLNFYDRIGVFNKWYDLDYNEEYIHLKSPFESASFLHSTTKGIFNEAGLGLGFKSYDESGLGIDISVNGGYKYSKNTIKNTSNPNLTVYTPNIKSNKFVLFIRLNIFYQIWY